MFRGQLVLEQDNGEEDGESGQDLIGPSRPLGLLTLSFRLTCLFGLRWKEEE